MPNFEPLVYDSSNKINAVYFSPEKVIRAIKKLKTSGRETINYLIYIFLMLHLKFLFQCGVYLIYL